MKLVFSIILFFLIVGCRKFPLSKTLVGEYQKTFIDSKYRLILNADSSFYISNSGFEYNAQCKGIWAMRTKYLIHLECFNAASLEKLTNGYLHDRAMDIKVLNYKKIKWGKIVLTKNNPNNPIFTSVSSDRLDISGFYLGIKRARYSELDSIERAQLFDRHTRLKLYHIACIKIRNGTAYMDRFTISVFRGDTSIIHNNGVRRNFFGYVSKSIPNVQLHLEEVTTHLLDNTFKKNENGDLVVHPESLVVDGKMVKGNLLIDHIILKPRTQNIELISEHPELFNQDKKRSWH